MARADEVAMRRNLTASFASKLVDIFKVSCIKIFLTLVCKDIAERGGSNPDKKVRVTLVKSADLIVHIFRRCAMLTSMKDSSESK